MEQPARHYNLGEIYGHETPLRRYTRLTVGENAGLGALFLNEFILGACSWIPGLAGIAVRHFLYPLAFRSFHRQTYLAHHVTLRCPRNISLERGVVIDEFVQLAANTRQVRGIVIGEDSFVRSHAMIYAGPPEGYVHIGRNSGIGQGTILYGNGGLTIGDNVMVAGQCFIVASSHDFRDPALPIADQGYHARGIAIENNVWIGAGAKILDGVTIGEGAIVGANAVVNRSVAKGARVGGVPARPLHRSNLPQ
jgi:acetyltransferase-like isoleucine patch superfamily enzyme